MGSNLDPRLVALLAQQFAEMVTEENDQPRISQSPTYVREATRPSENSTETTRIEEMFQLSAKSSAYIDDGKYEEAYGLVKKQYKLGADVHFASILIKYYVALMKTGRPDKAIKIRNELLQLLKAKLDADPEDLKSFGKQLNVNGKYFEAILFFQIAGSLFSAQSIPADKINGLAACILGEKLAILEMVEKRFAPKSLIQRHIIPEMRRQLRSIEDMTGVDKRRSCLVEAICLHHLEISEAAVDDIDASEASINDAINRMRHILGRDAERYLILGTHINNLGGTYAKRGNMRKAIETLTKATVVMSKATDYDTEIERIKDIQKAENAIRLLRTQL